MPPTAPTAMPTIVPVDVPLELLPPFVLLSLTLLSLDADVLVLLEAEFVVVDEPPSPVAVLLPVAVGVVVGDPALLVVISP